MNYIIKAEVNYRRPRKHILMLGVANILDGLVRLGSLGYFEGEFTERMLDHMIGYQAFKGACYNTFKFWKNV